MKAAADLLALRKWLKIAGLVLAVLMLRVWENVQAQRLGRKVALIRQEVDRLTYENGRLQTQIHHAIAPTRLETLAKERAMGPLAPERRIGIQP
jgi:hypothetical protein